MFENLFIGDKDEGFGGKVDDMALTAKSVDSWIVLNIEAAQEVKRERRHHRVVIRDIIHHEVPEL